MKICPVGAEQFQAGGRTDMRKPLVVFRDFRNTHKNRMIYEGLEVRLCLHTYTHKHTQICRHSSLQRHWRKHIIEFCIYICMWTQGEGLLGNTGTIPLNGLEYEG